MMVLADRQERQALDNHRREFGEWLARARNEAGLTQPGAAKIAGISRIQWARWEGGAGLPRRIAIPGIALALGVQDDEVYNRAGYVGPTTHAFPLDGAPLLHLEWNREEAPSGNPVLLTVWDSLTAEEQAEELRRLAERSLRRPERPLTGITELRGTGAPDTEIPLPGDEVIDLRPLTEDDRRLVLDVYERVKRREGG